MNQKELIEYCKTDLKDILKAKEEYIYGRTEVVKTIDNIDEYIEILESLLTILSRTRIRNTAEELPTREDGGMGMHKPYVMAHDTNCDAWEEIEIEHVAGNPDIYDFWTCVPPPPKHP